MRSSLRCATERTRSDPKIKYDRLAGRWFVIAATDAVPGRIVIASSNASTITAATLWSFFSFDNTGFPGGTNCAVDSPTFGLDPYALYIGIVQFCDPGSATYLGTSGFVVRKTSVIDFATIAVTAFHNLTATPGGAGPFAPVGVDTEDASLATGFFIGVDNASLGTLMLRRVSNPGGTPTISANVAIAVSPTAAPITVRHLGNLGSTNGQLDGGDDRLTSASLVNGRLWTAHTIGVTHTGQAGAPANRNGVRWYEIASLTTTPSVMQTGTLFSNTGSGSFDQRNYWVPSIATTTTGRSIVGFSAAGTSEFVNAGVAERFSSDGAGTLRAPQYYTAAPAAYNPPGDAGSPTRGRRWGGLSSTVVDGCDGSTIWTLQQFTDAINSYGLAVGRTVGPGAPTPVSVSPSVIPSGAASINLSVTATSSGGTAFFDPGAGYLCRLGAMIPGVAINSVTRTSATTATVNVSTVGAAPGLKTITLINPDGQSGSSGSILRVLPGALVTLESPVAGAAGQPLEVRGWAVDGSATSGTGVDAVHVWAYPAAGNPVFLGAATYGLSRPDVERCTEPSSRRQGSFSARPRCCRRAHGRSSSTRTARSPARLPRRRPSASRCRAMRRPSAPSTRRPTASPSRAKWRDRLGPRRRGCRRGGHIPIACCGGERVDIRRSGRLHPRRASRRAGTLPVDPVNDNAGWGFMVLTNMLPNQGNGTFDLHVFATDYAGMSTNLGTRRIIAANSGSRQAVWHNRHTRPGGNRLRHDREFRLGADAAALTIPINGSTIDVYVDGVFAGHPVYNNDRADIATLFPGFYNTATEARLGSSCSIRRRSRTGCIPSPGW